MQKTLVPQWHGIKEQKSLPNHVVGREKSEKQKLLQLQENIMKSLFSTPCIFMFGSYLIPSA